MCLNSPRFEPEVAYKTLAYKKKECSLNPVEYPDKTMNKARPPDKIEKYVLF